VQQLSSGLRSEKELTSLLNCGPEKHAAAVGALLADFKAAQKQLAGLWKELVPVFAKQVVERLHEHAATEERVIVWHREEASLNVLQSVLNAVVEELTQKQYTRPWLLVACNAERKLAATNNNVTATVTSGSVLIVGSALLAAISAQFEPQTQAVVQQVLDLLSIKGAFQAKLKRWQGKSTGAWPPSAKVLQQVELIRL
jgi:hypothetical protein